MRLALVLLIAAAEPDAGTKRLTVMEQAEIQERLRQLEKRCGKDAYRIAVGMTLERVKSCAETTFEIDTKAKVPNATVYKFRDDWNGGDGHIRVQAGKITAVDRPDPPP